MGKQVCAKHNEAYETKCRWCEPLCAWEEIPIWTGEMPKSGVGPYTPVNPLVGRTEAELQRMMNEAWVKLCAKEAPATLNVECYPGCPLCAKERP